MHQDTVDVSQFIDDLTGINDEGSLKEVVRVFNLELKKQNTGYSEGYFLNLGIKVEQKT